MLKRLLRPILLVIAMFIAAALWGEVMGAVAPHPYDSILSFAGGFTIGWFGWPQVVKLYRAS